MLPPYHSVRQKCSKLTKNSQEIYSFGPLSFFPQRQYRQYPHTRDISALPLLGIVWEPKWVFTSLWNLSPDAIPLLCSRWVCLGEGTWLFPMAGSAGGWLVKGYLRVPETLMLRLSPSDGDSSPDSQQTFCPEDRTLLGSKTSGKDGWSFWILSLLSLIFVLILKIRRNFILKIGSRLGLWFNSEGSD